MELVCNNDLCKYNTNCNNCNYCGTIVLDDDGVCTCYEDYKKDADYQNIFFKACKENGRIFKTIGRGKRAEINGFVVYYEAKDLTPDTWCTEERSGVGALYRAFCNVEAVPNMRRNIYALPYKNVKDLPYMNENIMVFDATETAT